MKKNAGSRNRELHLVLRRCKNTVLKDRKKEASKRACRGKVR